MTDTTAYTYEAPAKLMLQRTRTLHVLIPGGAGHLGRLVAGHLDAAGNAVTVLSRSGAVAPWPVVSWNGIDSDDWTRELEGADVVINLAGRSVNCRYNAGNRREILESRIRTTELLGEAIRSLRRPPRLWINASTATIYRHSLDREMDEASGELGGHESGAPDSWCFSIEVATRWEKAFFEANTPHTRKIALRSAMVMSAECRGTFDTLLRLVRFGLGGARVGIPASEWMLEVGAFFLRSETELILKSRRVVPGLLRASGFKFLFPEWRGAAEDLVQRWRRQAYEV